MIFSVFEQRDQLLELDKRRQGIAAAAPQPVTNSESVTAAPLAAGMPAGSGPAPMALKAAEPDIGKRRRKGRDRGEGGPEQPGTDLPADAPSDTAAVAEGARGVMEEDARKAVSEAHSTEGPGSCMQPGGLRPESVDRSYISAGHASDSPVAEPPRLNPMPMMRTYVPPAEPAVARLDPNVMGAHSLGSPSDR